MTKVNCKTNWFIFLGKKKYWIHNEKCVSTSKPKLQSCNASVISWWNMVGFIYCEFIKQDKRMQKIIVKNEWRVKNLHKHFLNLMIRITMKANHQSRFNLKAHCNLPWFLIFSMAAYFQACPPARTHLFVFFNTKTTSQSQCILPLKPLIECSGQCFVNFTILSTFAFLYLHLYTL